jgi:hypothetical protein
MSYARFLEISARPDAIVLPVSARADVQAALQQARQSSDQARRIGDDARRGGKK